MKTQGMCAECVYLYIISMYMDTIYNMMMNNIVCMHTYDCNNIIHCCERWAARYCNQCMKTQGM